MNCNLHLQFYSTLLEHSRKVLSCLRTCILYPLCQKYPLSPVLHMIGLFLAFRFQLSVTSSDSSSPPPAILFNIIVYFDQHSLSEVIFLLLTHLFIVFPHCNLSCARAGTLSELFIVVFVVPRIVLAKSMFSVPLYWLNKHHFERSLST